MVISRKKLLIPASCLAYLCFSLFLMQPWAGPQGLDIYYYALQTKALNQTGQLLFHDVSLVYYFLFGLNLIFSNPIVTVQVAAIILGLMSTLSLFMLPRVRQEPLLLIPAFLLVVNPLFFYLQWEFLKNLFALSLFLAGFSLQQSSRKTGSLMISYLLMIGAALSHRLIAIAVIALAVYYLARTLKIRRKPILFALSGAAVLFAAILLIISWNHWNERLSALSLTAMTERYRLILHGQFYSSQKLFFLMTQTLIPLSLLWFLYLYFKKKDFFIKLISNPGIMLYALSLLGTFPFLVYEWDGIGFRLLIMAPVFFLLWFLTSPLKIHIPVAVGMVAIIIFSGAQGLMINQSLRGFNYRQIEEELLGIEEYVEGKKLVVHRGAAGYLWYEKGIWTENFTPFQPDHERGGYMRLVYMYRGSLLERYLQEGESMPGFESENYLLVEESLWQRFYNQQKDRLRYLQSELNPNLPRPLSGFAINQDVAEELSPVTYPQNP